MGPAGPSEQLLRNLAANDERALRSVLLPGRSGVPTRFRTGPAAPGATAALVRLAALLAGDGSTTSLRWAVELAMQAGAQDDEIVAVLVTVAPTIGAARVVAAAPRLALAIGYDIEVEGWDGD
jgi:4-carboxymuconolactone decarboxylase